MPPERNREAMDDDELVAVACGAIAWLATCIPEGMS
jgi:hypothetical protein